MTAKNWQRRLNDCAIPCTEKQAEQLQRYHQLLLEWNQRMDLTAVSGEEEMLDRHYTDSLMALTVPGLIPDGVSLIDVGTGAGFPGLPLKILRPDLSLHLLDAQQKRLTFLSCVTESLGLDNVTMVHLRAEDGGRNQCYRERFDLAVARAVAPLPVLAELLLPFVKTGGKAVCWKGPALTEEREQGRKAAFLLGGKLSETIPYQIPGRDWSHCLVILEKDRPTPKIYPRKAGTPAKLPLGSTMLR